MSLFYGTTWNCFTGTALLEQLYLELLYLELLCWNIDGEYMMQITMKRSWQSLVVIVGNIGAIWIDYLSLVGCIVMIYVLKIECIGHSLGNAKQMISNSAIFYLNLSQSIILSPKSFVL